MAKEVSLEGLARYIADNTAKIGAARREVEEIQVGFNSAYVEWKAEHDAKLERLVEAVTSRWDETGPDMQARVRERVGEEQRIIAERRQALRDDLIPKTQAAADAALQEGQALTEKLRQENPRLDRWEEQLKAERQLLEQELERRNNEIRRLSGCLGVLFNFFKIKKLDAQRQQVIGQLKAIHKDLKQVREEWKTLHEQTGAEQGELQAAWQRLTLELAEMQGELAYLDEEGNRESLTFKRAVRYVVDNLAELIPCPAADIKQDLDAMVGLNNQTDAYQAGLGSVASLLAVLDGVTEGLRRFTESVQGLLDEQSMHSAYLPKLNVAISDEVVAFHTQWDGLAQKVRDDGRLCQHPDEFLAIVQPVLAQELAEGAIKRMFEEMGKALERAASRWKG